jgi:hypothetical protein
MIIPVIPKCITGTLPVPESSSQNLPSVNKLKVKVKVDFSLDDKKDRGRLKERRGRGSGVDLDLHLAFPGTSCYCPSFQFFDLVFRQHKYEEM